MSTTTGNSHVRLTGVYMEMSAEIALACEYFATPARILGYDHHMSQTTSRVDTCKWQLGFDSKGRCASTRLRPQEAGTNCSREMWRACSATGAARVWHHGGTQ